MKQDLSGYRIFFNKTTALVWFWEIESLCLKCVEGKIGTILRTTGYNKDAWEKNSGELRTERCLDIPGYCTDGVPIWISPVVARASCEAHFQLPSGDPINVSLLHVSDSGSLVWTCSQVRGPKTKPYMFLQERAFLFLQCDSKGVGSV